MKNLLKPKLLPWFTLAAGAVGLALRLWLYSCTDARGLLPVAHPANILLYILSAVVLVVLALCTRKLTRAGKFSRLFPASTLRGVGCALGTAGIVYVVITQVLSGIGFVSVLTAVVGVASAVCLVYVAYCRVMGIRPSYLSHTIVTVFFVLLAICRCQGWGAQPQVQKYLYQLLSCLFLMLTAYYHTALDVQKGSRRALVFCSQAAMFFSCLCLNEEDWIFYLCMAAWTGLDLCSLRKMPKEG